MHPSFPSTDRAPRCLGPLLAVLLATAGLPATAGEGGDAEPAPPTDDPAAGYGCAWTADFAWDRIEDLTAQPGETWDAKFAAACAKLVADGGGVVYVPAGDYEFADHLRLPNGVAIRGESPSIADAWSKVVPELQPNPVRDAREPRYRLRTHLRFPRYAFSAEGDGTPTETAFKGIRAATPATAARLAVVDCRISHGHVAFGAREGLETDWQGERATGRFLVSGCTLTSSAVAGTRVPRPFQHPWQRWTDPGFGAITCFASADVLVANNRIPRSPDPGFAMPGYRVYPSKWARKKEKEPVEREVFFDYDNRSGVRINAIPVLPQLAIWERHAEIQAAVEAGGLEAADALLAPGSLATGFVVRDNFIASTGRAAVKLAGRGPAIAGNLIRFEPNVVRTTSGGLWMDAFTNGNRAVEVRGWGWTIADNDYEVHSNYAPDGRKYNDGEGIMHEAWQNVGVRDSRLVGNVGNRYLCFWRVPARDLLIADNKIRIGPGFHAIYVNSQARYPESRFVDLPVADVVVRGNRTEGSGISVYGEGRGGNRIEDNRHRPRPGDTPVLRNLVGAEVADNDGYRVETERGTGP